ncbi:uncharacterized protein [Physcomitrium patens]|uniref:uncharacterized protein n=1 Tax=Physcomitrium patens TaxID=3218 RepID=UPI003CCCC5AB
MCRFNLWCGCLKRHGTTLFCSALPPGSCDILQNFPQSFGCHFPASFSSHVCSAHPAMLVLLERFLKSACGFLLSPARFSVQGWTKISFFLMLLRGLNTPGDVFMKDTRSLSSRTVLHPLRLATSLPVYLEVCSSS